MSSAHAASEESGAINERSGPNPNDRPRARLRRLVKLLLPLMMLVLGAILGTLTNNAWQRFERKLPSPFIAVVVSRESVDFPIPGEFLGGFQQAFPGGTTYIQDRDGKKVDIKTLEDLGSPEEAERIAQQLVNDRNCILVIGNSNSTLTDKALDTFLRSGDPPTYILPIATATELIIKAKTANHRAVLRMIPDNSAQADVIQRLLKKLAPNKRVAIYGDQENSFYSVNLLRDVASRIRKNGGRIVIEEMIGPTNSVYASAAAWHLDEPPEAIVYVGVAHHGLLLIDQLAALRIHAPIVFTDGCMVGSLRENISRIPNRAFVLSPVEASQTAAGQMPTFAPVGKDAYTLAQRIIASCPESTRAAIRACVSERKEHIQLLNGAAGEYRCDADGNNLGMSWKVYEVTRGRLTLFKEY